MTGMRILYQYVSFETIRSVSQWPSSVKQVWGKRPRTRVFAGGCSAAHRSYLALVSGRTFLEQRLLSATASGNRVVDRGALRIFRVTPAPRYLGHSPPG